MTSTEPIKWGEIGGNWSGQTVNVIGAGTSLHNFDFSKLQGIRIGANKVAFVVKCDVLVSIDHNFIRLERESIADFIRDGGEAILSVPAARQDFEPPIPGATYVERVRVHGDKFTDRRDHLQGLNSGFAAVNVAYLRRPARINLLGMDMAHGPEEHGGTHFHGGYGDRTQRNPKFLHRWANAFAPAAVQLRDAGIEVINYTGSPDSRITAFEKRSLSEIGETE